jgi:regulator of sirC expression with transglutaminase-like and TPR domain
MASIPNPQATVLPLKQLLDRFSLEDLPLDRAALAIAEPHCGKIDSDLTLRRLDRLAEEARELARPLRSVDSLLDALRRVLFETHGFRGNDLDYYNPANSFLNRVLETRKGIPITLSLLVIEVGRRLGIELVGIGLPCHFVVGYHSPTGTRYFDPYAQGREKTRSDCIEHVQQLSGGSVTVKPEHFDVVSKRTFLSRMLVNLRCIYRHTREPYHLVCVLRQLALLNPDDPSIHAELATTLAEVGNPWEAYDHMHRYLEIAPDSKQCCQVQTRLKELRKKLAILN